jgi:predicted nucleic acid-binding protein
MIAFDTNVLIYALSIDNPAKREAAIALIQATPISDVVLLWQVACETGAVLVRLRDRRKVPDEVFTEMRAIRDRFPLVLPTPAILDVALDIQRRDQVSYWDAMLLAACVEAGVTRLFSQDTQSAPSIRGVQIVNPFAGAPPGQS